MITDKLIDKIKKTQNPSVAGLDPRLEYVPEHIRDAAFAGYGKTPKGAAEAFFEFNKGLIDALYDVVPAVKPQIAMYEQFGADGIDCYIKTVRYAKAKGLVVIGDVKRSDIASTAKAYSDGHIGRADVCGAEHEVYGEDIITINPYLGSDSVEPYLGDCERYEKGLFVLVKTSNPGGGEIQDIKCADGRFLYEIVGELVNKWGEASIGKEGYSAVGAVVGATFPEQAVTLRKLMPRAFFLVPGYGAQGADADVLAAFFNGDGLGAVVNSSRGIIAAYMTDKYRADGKGYAEAARRAATDMKSDIGRVIG